MMSIYNKQRDGDWVTTKQTEIPIYGSDRLGLVRRDLVLTKGAVCEGCGEPKGGDPIIPSELRIVELNHDSPLTERNAKTEINLGEYIVLKNTSGKNLALGDVQVGQGGNWWQFSATDTLVPNAYALICYGTSADQTEFLSANNLPTALTSDASVQWHWQSTVTFADVEGQTAIRLYENGKPGATLDQVYWNPDGLQAANAHCDATCQADPNREAVYSLQLNDFTFDPVNPWDESKWTTAEATAKGKGSSQPEAPSAMRNLLKKEYELKDHLGNVHVVVTDRKHSTIGAGPSIGEFKADVVVMRDYYPFGMEMEGQGYSAGEYRYGFNGMERDDEMKGSGDSYDFGARMYDPRVARWMSRDPMESKYVSANPYLSFGANPIKFIDPGGETLQVAGLQAVAYQDIQMFLKSGNRSLITISGGGNIIWTEEYLKKTTEQKVALARDNSGFALVDALINSTETYRHEVQETENMYTTGYDRSNNRVNGERKLVVSNEPYLQKLKLEVGSEWLQSIQPGINKGTRTNGADPGSLPIDNLGGHTIFPNIPFLARHPDGNIVGNLRYANIFHELLEAVIMVEGVTDMIHINVSNSAGVGVPQLWRPAHDASADAQRNLYLTKENNGYGGLKPGGGARLPLLKENFENDANYNPLKAGEEK